MVRGIYLYIIHIAFSLNIYYIRRLNIIGLLKNKRYSEYKFTRLSHVQFIVEKLWSMSYDVTKYYLY